MNPEWAAILQALSQKQDRDFSVYEEGFLVKTLEKRLAAAACPTPAAYLAVLAQNGAEAEALAASLSITYSEFFRSPLAFALLEELVLPRLLEAKADQGEVRVWSAGCAAGQETYSIAMLLEDLSARRGAPAAYRLFATDNAEAELAAARQGVYAASAIQKVRQQHLRAYFTLAGDAYRIRPQLKDRIEFSAYDLLDERSTCPPPSIYGDFDLVFCSNVLFYYRPDVRQFILSKLFRCLAQGGYLVTGEAERDSLKGIAGFRAVAPPAPVYQKTTK
jgi:chemotaxis methyl-accepting protein methylase